jgi:transcriptional regulatory protein LevR
VIGRTDLEGRLDLLERAGEITSRARQLTATAIARIEREFDVRLDESNAAQLVTHLAMALSRLDRRDVETSVPAVVDDELAAYTREFAFSRALLDDLGSQLERPVPEAEVAYMTVHLAVLTA